MPDVMHTQESVPWFRRLHTEKHHSCNHRSAIETVFDLISVLLHVLT